MVARRADRVRDIEALSITNQRETIVVFDRATGRPADGGPTASKFLMQFCADLTDAELRVAAMSDCSPLGAMLAGQLGRELHPSIDSIAKLPRDDVVYRPTGQNDRMAAAYRGWHRAVAQVLGSPEVEASKSVAASPT